MDNEKIEELLTQLIEMVEDLNTQMQASNEEFNRNNEKSGCSHNEIIDRLKAIENDQDLIWEKSIQHENEIRQLKRKLSSMKNNC